jgi:predicted nucleic acid-binding protein
MVIAQDTNVFVAALRSQEGASAKVLDRCLAHEDQAVMGAALFAEYEQLVCKMKTIPYRG